MNEQVKRFADRLGQHRPGRVAIICMGNDLRGDDGFGAAVAARLMDDVRGNPEILLLDVGTVPENYLGPIVSFKPDTILFVDAAEAGQTPGTLDLAIPGEIRAGGLTTHDFPLTGVIQFLTAECGADMYLLAVQPRLTRFGEEMSAEVKDAVEPVVGWLRGWLSAEQ